MKAVPLASLTHAQRRVVLVLLAAQKDAGEARANAAAREQAAPDVETGAASAEGHGNDRSAA